MHLHDVIPSPTLHDNRQSFLSDDQKKEREVWDNNLEYYMAVLGFAAGFGSVWRFPFLVWKNGGGVFLIPYTIFLIILAIPLFYLEVALGQINQKGSPKLFESLHKKWKGLGLVPIFVAFNMSTYYNLIESYSFNYLFLSFASPLPWDQKDPKTGSILNKSYFTDEFLQLTPSASEFGSFNLKIFLGYFISMVFVFISIYKGIKLSGKITIYTAIAPYLLLIILLLRGLFLAGSSKGLAYLFYPDISKLLHLSVWTDAVNQVFFQISIGVGIITLFGSYRKKNEDITSSSYNIPIAVVLCGFLSALTIFSYIGNMSETQNIPISDIPLSGPELTFVAYPTVLTLMPLSNFLAILFYLMMIFLGIDTQFALVEGVCAAIVDEGSFFSYKLRSETVRLIVSIVVIMTGILYSFGNGFYLLHLIDEYSTTLPFLFTCLVECFFFCKKFEFEELEIKILENTGKGIPKFIRFSIQYLCIPILLLLLVLSFFNLIYKTFSLNFGIAVMGWFFSLYPFCIAFYYYTTYKDVIVVHKYKSMNEGFLLQELKPVKSILHF